MTHMTNIREAVQRELDRRKWTAYRLVQEAQKFPTRDGKPISPDTVYKFLSGSRAITDKFLEPILEALGLELRRKR